MRLDDIVEHLKGVLPESLARDLVVHFGAMRMDVATGTLERSSPGKFVETLVQSLQYLDDKSFDPEPKIDEYLRKLESHASGLPDDLRLSVSRTARAMYSLRRRRGIVHKNGMDPTLYDLRFLYSSSQWILSELVRFASATNVSEAHRLVEFVQQPIDQFVEDFGDRRLVLHSGSISGELLLLLRHYYPERVDIAQLTIDMSQHSSASIQRAIRHVGQRRFLEGDKYRGYKLTQLGHREATTTLMNVSNLLN